jgi:hypothetical protein
MAVIIFSFLFVSTIYAFGFMFGAYLLAVESFQVFTVEKFFGFLTISIVLLFINSTKIGKH